MSFHAGLELVPAGVSTALYDCGGSGGLVPEATDHKMQDLHNDLLDRAAMAVKNPSLSCTRASSVKDVLDTLSAEEVNRLSPMEQRCFQWHQQNLEIAYFIHHS